jgi:DNA polymerase elongation subunit (family B)
MNRVVFDIETVGLRWEAFDDEQREYLRRTARPEESEEDVVSRLGLTPLTGEIVTIAMLNPDSGQGKVFYQHPGGSGSFSEDGLVEFLPGTEAEILEAFWKAIPRYQQFITFNGRGFDCPFLLLRSTLLGVKPTRNLMPYRYAFTEHVDLLDQLTFYGAFRKFSLDFYTRGFGITSPKSEGVSGADVGRLFASGEFLSIAEYCLRDVRATAELFRRWQLHLAFPK